MGIQFFDKYAPKERELPSEEAERNRREHPEWFGGVPPLTAKEKRAMDREGLLTGARRDPARCIEQKDVPARFPVREIKGDRENDRPAARPDPNPFKLGR